MKLLKYITDKPLTKNDKIWKRFASRAIIFDENNMIPMEYVSKLGYYKIPGGGIEKGETKLEACKREIKEETGCEMEATGELGRVEEYRSKYGLYQTSYCYIGKVLKKGTPHFEEGEIADGHMLVWLSLEDALLKVKNTKVNDYEAGYIQKRDLRFLEEATGQISKS